MGLVTGKLGAIEAKCPAGLTMLSSVVKVCTGGFTRLEQLEVVRKFFADRSQKVSDAILSLIVPVFDPTSPAPPFTLLALRLGFSLTGRG